MQRSRLILAAAVLALLAGTARAEPSSVELANRASQYNACLTLAQRSPERGLKVATAWAAKDGGAPARHCRAVALIVAKRYLEAGTALDALAKEETTKRPGLKANLYDQAANAWLLAGDLVKALASANAGLAVTPKSAPLLVDRGRIRGAQENYALALKDLNAALKLDEQAPTQAFRASALRHLGRPAEALTAATRALTLDENNPSAALERALALRDLGRTAEAHKTLEKLAADHAGTPAADSATAILQEMEAAK